MKFKTIANYFLAVLVISSCSTTNNSALANISESRITKIYYSQLGGRKTGGDLSLEIDQD